MLAVNAILAAALGAMWLGPQGLLRHTDWQAPAPQAPNLDDAAKAALVANPALSRPYPEVGERPLFAASRQPGSTPKPEDAASAPPPPIALDKMVLTGIVAGPRLTGVLAQVDGESRFLRKGDQVGDWSLDAIKGRDVTFVQQGGESRTLSLNPSFIEGAEAPANAAANAQANVQAAKRPTTTSPQSSNHPRQAPSTPAAVRPTPVPPIGTAPAAANAQTADRQPKGNSGRVSFGGRRAVEATPEAKPAGGAK
jgi:hypothetical protein